MVIHAHRRRDRERASRLNVLLDGRPAPRAFYADGRRGVIREFVEDANDNLVIRRWMAGKEHCAELEKRERRGKVTWMWLG